jgi:hypothetical protein
MIGKMGENLLENLWDIVFSRTEHGEWVKNHDLIISCLEDSLVEFAYSCWEIRSCPQMRIKGKIEIQG